MAGVKKLFAVRNGLANDAPKLVALMTKTFSDTFGHLYPPEDLANFVNSTYNQQAVEKDLSHPQYQTFLLYDQAEPEQIWGYSMLHEGSRKEKDHDLTKFSLEIKRFYVDKSQHGTGAAYVLMDHLMKGILENGAFDIVWLGVWENNKRAQKFYEKYNFYEVGAHEFQIGNCVDRDILAKSI